MREPRPWPIDAPELKSPKVTLFVIMDGVPMWAASVKEKRELVEQTEGMPLWGTWRGEHATHVFEIDRAQAELEVLTGPDRSRSLDPGVEALLAWFNEEARRQGFVTGVDGHFSKATPEVTAAKGLLAQVPKSRIAAVAQFALTDDRRPFGWRGNVLTMEALGRQWNRLVAAWEQAGAPAYDKGFIYVSEEA